MQWLTQGIKSKGGELSYMLRLEGGSKGAFGRVTTTREEEGHAVHDYSGTYAGDLS
jgi:hypothetical protein